MADNTEVFYIDNDNPLLELDLRKPHIDTGLNLFFNEGDSGYTQDFVLIHNGYWTKDNYAKLNAQLSVTNISNNENNKYDVDVLWNSSSLGGSFFVPDQITSKAGIYECFLILHSAEAVTKTNDNPKPEPITYSHVFSTPHWRYDVISASNNTTTLVIPEARADILQKEIDDQVRELRGNIRDLANRMGNSAPSGAGTGTSVNLDPLRDDISKNAQDIATNKESIGTNSTNIADLLRKYNQLIVTEAELERAKTEAQSDISANQTAIANIQQKLKNLPTSSSGSISEKDLVRISALESDNTQNKANIKANSDSISDNADKIRANSNSISALDSRVTTLENKPSSGSSPTVPENISEQISALQNNQKTNNDSISVLKTNQQKNTNDIYLLKKNQANDENTISTNTANISKLQDTVKNLNSGATTAPDLAQVKADIQKNTTDIANVKSKAGTNSDNIDSLWDDNIQEKKDIADLKSDNTTNKQNIANNTSAISTLSEKVDNIKPAESPDLTQIKADIQTNSGNIGKNTTDIANIKQKQTDDENTISTLSDKVDKLKSGSSSTTAPDLTEVNAKIKTNSDNIGKNATDIVYIKRNQLNDENAISTNMSNISKLQDAVKNVGSGTGSGSNNSTFNLYSSLENMVDLNYNQNDKVLKNNGILSFGNGVSYILQKGETGMDMLSMPTMINKHSPLDTKQNAAFIMSDDGTFEVQNYGKQFYQDYEIPDGTFWEHKPSDYGLVEGINKSFDDSKGSFTIESDLFDSKYLLSSKQAKYFALSPFANDVGGYRYIGVQENLSYTDTSGSSQQRTIWFLYSLGSKTWADHSFPLSNYKLPAMVFTLDNMIDKLEQVKLSDYSTKFMTPVDKAKPIYCTDTPGVYAISSDR